jgi:hypothetical protein
MRDEKWLKDQLDFLLARTCFDLLFSEDGSIYVISTFVVNQFMNVVLFGKLAARACAVFQHAALDVVGDACVQNCVVRVGHDVNAVLPIRHINPLLSLRGCHCDEPQRQCSPDEAIS